jgi:RNA polymerase sigma-70 factor (ECF subfamily)
VAEQDELPQEHEVFAVLAVEHFQALYRVARRLVGDPEGARDLVQETYLRAYRFFHRFEPGTNAKAWLLTILRHTFINAYRKTGGRRQVAWPTVEPWYAADVLPVLGGEVVASAATLRHVVQDEVMAALEALPEAFRRVVVLADLADLSYQEIAVVLGCPIGTVMSRLCRGRQQLRQRLEPFARQAGYLQAKSACSGVGFPADPKPARHAVAAFVQA